MFSGNKHKNTFVPLITKERLVTVFLLSATIFAGLILRIVPATASAISDADLLTEDGGCSFSLSALSEHSITVNSGASITDFGSTKITTICDDAINFKIYSIGFSNDTEGNTNLIHSSLNQNTIPTNTETGGSSSQWSMKISKDTSSYLPANLTIENNFNASHVVPGTSTMVASFLGSTDTEIGSSILATYSAYISSAQAAGTYVGKVKYTLVAEVRYSSYTITYNENADGDTVAGMPTPNPFQGETSNPSVLLSSAVPVRYGYNFLGWATSASATTATYQPGDSITVAAGSDSISLYAVWSLKLYSLYYNSNYQDEREEDHHEGQTFYHEGTFTWSDSDTSIEHKVSNYENPGYGFAGWSTDPNVGSSINQSNHRFIYGEDEVFTTSDTELLNYANSDDEINVYAVWVPSSGNMQSFSCNSLSVGQITALTDTRDNNTYTIFKPSNGVCWMVENLRLDPGDASLSIDNTNNPTSSFITSASSSSSTLAASWCHTDSAACDNQVLYNTDAISNPGVTVNDYGAIVYGYGVYYNWFTATAGNGVRGTSTTTAGDICPQGWHLPSQTESSSLLFQDPDTFPYNAVKSGNIWNGEFDAATRSFIYWTSTGYNTSDAYRIQNSSTNYAKKYAGESIRCLANTPTTYSISYNLNGASGTAPAGSSVTTGNTYQYFTVTSSQPTRDHYTFLGWSTNSSATTADYTAGDQLRATTTTTELFAVWEPLPYRIIYNGNNPTAGNMSSVEHQNVTIGSNIRLVAPNYYKSGYALVGWSTNPNESPTAANADIFGPNEYITVTGDLLDEADANSVVTLYAIWLASAGQMQDFSCDTLAAGAHTALTDNRDGNVYYIAKLADGKCWSTNPLRLDVSTTTFNIENTNNPTGSFAFHAIGTASSDSVCPTSSDAGDCNESIIYNTTNTSTLTLSSNPVDRTSNLYYYGNYYNWYTATAGNTTTSGDICPQGWHLPTGTFNGEWSDLAVSMGGIRNTMDDTTTPTGAVIETALISFPNNFIRSGHKDIDTESHWYRGRTISASSSTPLSATNIYTGYVNMNDGAAAYRMVSVICMANDITQYSLSFDINGGTGSVPTTQTASSSHAYYDFTIPQSSLTKNHYLFRGWSTDSSATTPDYVASDTISITNTNASTILYAVWEPKTYDIRMWDELNGNVIGQTGSFKYGEGFSWDSNTTASSLKSYNMYNIGYGFVGWSADLNVAPSINASNHSRIYGPNERFTTSQDDLVDVASDIPENGVYYVNLYPVWVPSAGDLQNWSSCSSMATGEITALSDTRDNNTYAVAKLADGRCWMIEDLRLDPSANGTSITASNTNNPTSSFVAAIASAQPTDPASFCHETTANCQNKITYSTQNIANLSTPNPDYSEPRYGYGVYYNWYTATAGNGTRSKTSGNVSGDICPSGWRLPTGNTSGELYGLAKAVGGNSPAPSSVRTFPNNFQIGGFAWGEDPPVLSRESIGWYHSSTASSDNATYDLYINDGQSALPSNNTSRKERGRVIRCILKNN